jgi:hypothetical protein
MVDKIRIIALDDEVLFGYSGNFLRPIATTVNITGNTLLVSNSNSGTILYCSNTLYNTVITLSTTAQTGVSVSVIQGAPSKNVRFLIQGTTGYANHRSGYANTSGQWAIVSATVLENETGNTARWLLMGDLTT